MAGHTALRDHAENVTVGRRWRGRAGPSSTGWRDYRDAHAASAQASPASGFAVAESDGVMLVGGVTARARRVLQRFAVR
jgi:hypothetical protein